MMIKDFDFASIHAVRKQCWEYKSDGNTPIKKGKNLYPLEAITGCDTLKGFFIEIIEHTYGDSSYIIWNDLGNSCVKYENFHPAFYDAELIMQNLLPYKGLEGFRHKLYLLKTRGLWIKNTEILALADNEETELAIHYQAYHDKFKAEREEEKRRQNEKCEQQAREKKQKHKEEIAAQLKCAEQNIKARKDLKNTMIDGKSIVLYLMNKYGIKVPIKTQGWFNQKLAFVKWIDGEITYSYYRTKGSTGSQTAFKYLRMLEEAVNAA